MVDPVDLVLAHEIKEPPIKLARGLEIGPERLLEYEAAPSPLFLAQQARLGELLGDDPKHVRRRRQIKQTIAAGAHGGTELFAQRAVGIRIVEIAAQVGEARGQVAHHLGRHRPGGKLAQGLAHARSERVVRQLAARNADHGEFVRQQTRGSEIIKRRHQQSFGQIARGAEDHEGTRAGAVRRRLRIRRRSRRQGWRRDVHQPPPFGSTWPPKPLRMAERTRSAKLSSSRERKRA
jgi:hypothetical protein